MYVLSLFCFFLQIPGDLAAPDLVKSLNNRSRVYVKLGKMELAEADASEVCSFNTALPALTNPNMYDMRAQICILICCPRRCLTYSVNTLLYIHTLLYFPTLAPPAPLTLTTNKYKTTILLA